MNLIIQGHHVEVTPAMRDYVHGKLAVEDKLRQKAEVTLRVRGGSLHAESTDADMYAAIDLLMDKLDRQVLRHKDRVKTHTRDPLKHQQTQAQQ